MIQKDNQQPRMIEIPEFDTEKELAKLHEKIAEIEAKKAAIGGKESFGEKDSLPRIGRGRLFRAASFALIAILALAIIDFRKTPETETTPVIAENFDTETDAANSEEPKEISDKIETIGNQDEIETTETPPAPVNQKKKAARKPKKKKAETAKSEPILAQTSQQNAPDPLAEFHAKAQSIRQRGEMVMQTIASIN